MVAYRFKSHYPQTCGLWVVNQLDFVP